jgi:peptide/nickel transport system substrate-binding protein
VTRRPAGRRERCGWLLLLFALAGCAGPPPDAIRFGLPTAPATLDPRYATDAVSARLVRLLHRPLVDFDAASRPRPALADWQQLSPTRYRFMLVADARFANGSPVTATDVVATYRAVLDPGLASPHRDSLANIAAVSATGQRTVDFALHGPDPLFPGTLVIGVLAAADAGRPRDAWQTSSGPFERVTWTAGGDLRLRRRADGALFDFLVVRDATVRALKLIGGELDLTQGNLPPELFDWLATRPGLHAERVAGATFSYLGFNLMTGATAVREVREAVLCALDRDAIVKHVFRGQARVAAGLFPPEHWAAPPHPRQPACPPGRARALLATAGYGDAPLRVELKTSADYFRVRIATILQAQLAAAGIDLRIQSLDWGTFYGDIKEGRFELYGLSWVGLELPDIFRHAFHSASVPPRGANRGRYRAAAMDRLIEAAEREPDPARRVPHYHAIAERLLYDLPYVPLWYEDQTVVMRDDIAGYHTDADGTFDALATTVRVAPGGR